MQIKFNIYTCFLGYVIIAISGKGICFLTFSDEKEQLISKLKNSFKDVIIHKSELDKKFIQKVLNFIENPFLKMDFPLDIIGTEFQKRVWQEILKIPPGETITYKELAYRTGNEKAIRAVANACGKNKIAVIIPCHRVIKSDGSLGGYSAGLWRKRELLKREIKIKCQAKYCICY